MRRATSISVRSLVVAGQLVATSGALADSRTRELEVKIWTAEESELPKLEREVVRMIQTDAHSASAHHLLSHIQVRMFSKEPSDLYLLKQASDLAQQAVDLDPRGAYGFVALADILDLMGNPDRGLRLLDEAEAAGLEPNWRFYFTRARLMSEDTATTKILGLLETALGFTDSEPRIIVPYVVAILQSETQGEALVAKLAAWNERFPSPLFKLTMAITLAELDQYQKAHALYAEILKAEPDHREANVNDAIILYKNLKDSAKAIAILEKVLIEHGAEMTPAVRATVTAHLGAAHLAGKAFNAAEDRFVEAVAGDESNTSVLDFVARAYRDGKSYDRLASLIRRLNDRVRGNGVLHALLGETLSEHLTRHDEALRAFADAIVLEPSRSDFYNGMGLTYYRKKSYDQALRLFTSATDVNPSDATARYNEACVLAIMGRAEEALASLGEAVSLDPRLMRTAREDLDFASIRGQLKFQDLVQGPIDDGAVGH